MLDRIPVVVAFAAVVFMVINMLIQNKLTLMKGCCLLIHNPMMVRILMLLSACHNCDCHCHCRIAFQCGVPVALGGHGDKDVDRGCDDVVDVNGLLRSETNKHDELDYNCNQSNRIN